MRAKMSTIQLYYIYETDFATSHRTDLLHSTKIIERPANFLRDWRKFTIRPVLPDLKLFHERNKRR